MKTALNAIAALRSLPTDRAFSSIGLHRSIALRLAAFLLAGSLTLPPAALAFTVRGIGAAALVGHDLTDPEDDGAADSNLNYNATFSASEEANFTGTGFGQGAFNVFDNKLGSNGDKWCCGTENNFPTNPISVDAAFPAAHVLRRFTLASGDDSPERDPRVWKIQGSNDGVTFTDIYVRNNPDAAVWTDRNQVVEFVAGIDYALPVAYPKFRFLCTATGATGGARYQLAEIEYLDTAASLVVTTTADENNGTSDPTQGTGTSLREALAYAATLTGAQTIAFSQSADFGAVDFSDGTARTITIGASALPAIASDLTITGPGATLLTVSGNNVGGRSVFIVDAGKTVTLAGLTVAGGSAFRGGGINNAATLTIQNCTISGNAAPSGYGGGIFNKGSLTIESCTIAGNSAFGGGGIADDDGAGGTKIRNSTIANNSATGGGGGITHGYSSTLTVTNSTIAKNSASFGGAIINYSTLTVQDCTVTANTATAIGGGIEIIANASVSLANSIVAGNTAGTGPDINSEPGANDITSNGFNFIGNTTGISNAGTLTDKTFASTGKTLADLLETAAGVPVLKDNGGPTFTVKVVPGSPAIDAGDPNFNPNAFTPALTFDQRGLGFDRVVKGKSASATPLVDIGAFEVQVITFAPGVVVNGVDVDAHDGPLDLHGATIGAMPPGGTFSGPGVDANGVFRVDLLSPGTYSINYQTSTPDAYGNTGSAGFTITVTATNPYLRIIATAAPDGSGIDVPNTVGGTKFTQLGLASMDDATAAMGPAGLVGARVRIKPPGGAEVPAIYQGSAATALISFLGTGPAAPGGILVRGGDAAPNGSGGMLGTFASFKEPVFGNGYAAFGATLSGPGISKTNDTGLWSTLSGQLDLVAAEGSPAPDAGGAVFDQFQSYALTDDGTAVTFIATLKGPGVKGTNKTGIWQKTVLTTRLLFRTGDLYGLDGGTFPIKTLKLFVPAKTIPGQRRSYATGEKQVNAFATFSGGHEALLRYIDFGLGSFFRDVRLENTSVGHPGIPSINGNGAFAMRAKLSIGAAYTQGPGKVTGKTDGVILTGSGQFNIGIFAQEGSAVSGSIPDLFTAFEEPAYNDNFAVAFFANVAAPGLSAKQKRILFYDGPPNFDSVILARTGTAAAELTGPTWKSFTAMVLPDSGYGPVFLGTLEGPGVLKTTNIGLWATDLTGKVRLLLRTGDSVSVNGAPKTVSLINTLGAALDSPGQGRYVDRKGDVSAQLTFTDGSTALVYFGMPTAY